MRLRSADMTIPCITPSPASVVGASFLLAACFSWPGLIGPAACCTFGAGTDATFNPDAALIGGAPLPAAVLAGITVCASLAVASATAGASRASAPSAVLSCWAADLAYTDVSELFRRLWAARAFRDSASMSLSMLPMSCKQCILGLPFSVVMLCMDGYHHSQLAAAASGLQLHQPHRQAL